MADEVSLLRTIARHLALAIRPLEAAVQDAESFSVFMPRIGWDVQDVPPEFIAIGTGVAQAVTAFEALADDATLDDYLQVITAVGNVYRGLEAISQAPAGIDPTDVQAFLGDAAHDIFEILLVDYLAAAAPSLHGALSAVGVIETAYVERTLTRPGYLAVQVKLDRISEVLREPHLIPGRIYGWGGDHFAFEALAGLAVRLFQALGWEAYYEQAPAGFGAAFQGPIEKTRRAATSVFRIPLLHGFVGGEQVEVGIGALELPSETDRLAGIVVLPYAPPGLTTKVEAGTGWTLEARAGSDFSSQFGLVLRPGEASVRYPFQPGMELPSAGFGLTLGYDSGEEPRRLFGNPDGTRLELKSATLSAEFNVKAGDIEMKLGAAPEDVALVLSTKDLDGFLGSALGGKDVRVEFPLGLHWSSRTGLNFVAGLGLEFSAYPHLDFKVIRIDRVDLGLRFATETGEPPRLEMRVAAALSGSIGPISYVVDRLGINLPITLEPGNAGPVDIGFGVLWPLGLGLVVDAGPVTGGGFIKLDPDKGRYVGMVELKMFEIGVTATGILDTKDASGNDLPSPGFSFFISLAAEFSPIQLGYGFTLNGLGGLAGINRRMDADAILSGVREGALDSIMFPDDPVANANTIVSNLTTIFPVAMNRYVFGPMALLGWGTPTLVKAELAVVLEVPAPIKLAFLGKASVAIPEDEAIISINLDTVGILDFGRKLFAVDASMRDSYITTFALYGDMAMRLTWGENPSFAIAIGGLNPHFPPPLGFPSLRRITVALGMGENPRVTLEGYFAVTSNSLQFGAKAELYAERAGFSIHGWLGFDALLIFEPLSFEVDFAAGMTLNRGSSRIAGVTVRGTLTGPSPFHAWGEGCVSLFFFDVCVPFDATFGEERAIDLPDKDPWPVLEAAVKEPANWAAELGAGITSAVSLRPPPQGSEDLLVHPMGAATLRQKVLPFNRPLERFGQFDITGPNRYDIKSVETGPNDEPPWHVVTDHFPPGDYEMLSETEKLSRDSFEQMDAGVSVGSELVGIDAAAMKVATVKYETRIIDAGWKARILPPFRLDRALQLLAGLRSSKSSSPLTKSGRRRFARDAGRTPGVKLAVETYGVASVDTLAPRPEVASATTRGGAHLAIKTKVGRGARRAHVQVVPSHELEIAA